MLELNHPPVTLNEPDLVAEVDRIEQELRTLRLPRPSREPARRPTMRSGLRIAAATAILAGAFAAGGHLPPF